MISGPFCKSLLVTLFLPAIAAYCALPDAETVMKNVIRRSQETTRAGDEEKYSYQKRTIEEELDASGKPTHTKEELYEVFPIQGVPFSRLIKIQNRDLTKSENQEQDKKEEEFRKKVAQEEAERGPATNSDKLDEALINRFAFKVENRESLGDRRVLVLSFHPKPTEGREKSVGDKVLSRLAGTLWVDEQDWELAQLKVGLTAELSLGWFGMIGSLKQFDLTIERSRLPEGVWVDTKQIVVLGGRKVLSSMHYRNTEESSRFRKE